MLNGPNRMTMDREAELRIIRAAYAKQILAAVSISDPRVEAAYAAVRREDFLGPGPWPICRLGSRYVDTPSDDPVFLYTDDLVGIVKERMINNGQPSFHAALLHAAAPREGEHVVHVGTGVGYYTAMMAHLVGSSGRVTGIEYEPALASRAKANFRSYTNVEIIEGDGSTTAFDEADVIYVNAGATRPANSWLDRLKNGGRLILPLTSDSGFVKSDCAVPANDDIARDGAVFQIVREDTGYSAKWISPVCIFPCVGSREEVSERALAEAFENGGMQRVTRLYRNQDIEKNRCWVRGPDWCLAYA